MESSRIAPRGVSSFSVARSMEKALASEQQLKPWYSKVLCMGGGNLAIGCTTLILVSTLHAFFPGMELHLFREWTEGVPSNCVNVITSHYDPRYIRWLLLNGNCFLPGVLATWVLQRWDGHELCTLCWKTWSLSSPCQCPSSWADICCLLICMLPMIHALYIVTC